MDILRELLGHCDSEGRVEFIGIALTSRGAMQDRETVQLVTGGIEGDHHCRPAGHSKRQVTLIQAEHLPVVAALLRRSSLEPNLLRRNIVVSAINLAALRYQTFRIGSAVLRGTGSCPPCSRMEENLGTGGYAAMLNHGGITAIVESPGVVSVGDCVVPLGVHADSLKE